MVDWRPNRRRTKPNCLLRDQPFGRFRKMLSMHADIGSKPLIWVRSFITDRQYPNKRQRDAVCLVTQVDMSDEFTLTVLSTCPSEYPKQHNLMLRPNSHLETVVLSFLWPIAPYGRIISMIADTAEQYAGEDIRKIRIERMEDGGIAPHGWNKAKRCG